MPMYVVRLNGPIMVSRAASRPMQVCGLHPKRRPVDGVVQEGNRLPDVAACQCTRHGLLALWLVVQSYR
jgi:hypothetical protein